MTSTNAKMKELVKAARSEVPQRLKPMVSSWMLANQRHEFSDEAIEVAVETLKRSRRTPKYMRNSPSAGHRDFCDRQSVIAFLGYPSDPIDDIVTLNKFADGNYGHLMWQLRLFDMGFMAAEHVEMFVHVPEWGVAGTCDGVLSVPMEGWNPRMSREETRALVNSGDVPVWWSLLEVKRMASYRFRKAVAANDTESKIHWQGSDYLIGANKKLRTLFQERGLDEQVEDVCYWHENKDTNEFIEFDIVPSENLLQEQGEFYSRTLLMSGRRELPPRPYEDGSPACNFCPVSSHCRRLEAKGRTKIKPFKGAYYDGTFPEPEES